MGTNPAEASGNAPQEDKSKAISTNDAAEIFKNSIIGDTGEPTDDGEGKSKIKGKTEKTTKRTPKESDKDTLEDDDAQDSTEDEEAEDSQSEDDDADEVDDEDGAEEEEEDSDVSDEDAEDDEDTPEAEDEDLHTVVVDGVESQVTYEELVNGYQRNADYTKKSMELAQERKALAAEKDQIADLPKVKEAYKAETGRFSQNAELVLVAFENGFMPKKPADELRSTNPAEYLVQKEKHQEALQFVHGLKGELHKLQQQAVTENKQRVIEGRTKLVQVQPELQDPTQRGKLQNYVLNAGFTEDQMKNEGDHRLFQFAFKAMKWDEFVERSKQKPKPKNKRPKVIKQTKTREDKNTLTEKRNSEAMSRHEHDKSMKSASAVIARRIENSSRKKRR